MEGLEVPTACGIVQGHVLGDADLKFTAFQGIPYAKPPLEDLRFKDPQPPLHWNGIYNATYERSVCAQSDLLFQNKEFLGSEDCLYLNVYRPFKPVSMLLPVMMWIHGGGFFAGSGNRNLYGPEFLVKNDVIVVTINYRLGVLGFLCLENKDVPGNAGMKDMVMALRWIRNNIEKFGGDPNNVSIFGESAGGSAVQFLMASKMAQGLFHKAISQSGSCLNQWAYTIINGKQPSINAHRIPELTGHQFKTNDDLLRHLQSIDIEDLVRLSHKTSTFEERKRDASFSYAPVVEKQFAGVEAFLDEPAIDSLTTGIKNIPHLAGYNDKEGLLWMANVLNDPDYFKNFNNNFQYFVPLELGYKMNTSESIQFAKKIQDFYFGERKLDNDSINEYIDLMTDNAFLKDLLTSVKLMSKSVAPIYFYRFSFDGNLNYLKNKLNLKMKGAAHEDDLGYIFKQISSKEPDTKSALIRERMTKMWTNFAKFGDPTPEKTELLPEKWRPIGDEVHYMEIGEDMSMCVDPEKERMKFWL